jgi:hypothetical protein
MAVRAKSLCRTIEMRLQILTLTIACLAAAPVWAGAGLTSAGVVPTPTNNQQDEPTLAQVAPTQGPSGTTAAGTNAAGTVVPGTASGTAAQAGTVAGPGGTASGAATGGATAPARTLVATPPPPPDPATLPVSVMRPLNKAAADASAPVDAAVSPQQVRVPTPSATPAKPVATTPARSMPSGAACGRDRRPILTRRRAPVEMRHEPADASSSGLIYTGVGIAATILLLYLLLFPRRRRGNRAGLDVSARVRNARRQRRPPANGIASTPPALWNTG